jgi:putative Holliday junction resolvase
MKILGVDIGFSRVGFAIGDTLTSLAFPREITQYSKYLLHIEKYIQDEAIEKIVVGMPHSLSGQDNDSEHIQKIADEIEKITQLVEKFPENIAVETFDEQFTSKIAEQSLYTMGFSAKKQKGKKDDMAAAIILQGYLDRQKFL